jgi:DGQHR domain-containing protein
MKKSVQESPIRISVPCIKVTQPIGTFYIASIDHKILCDITFFDVRRILREERAVERYLGIQRPLVPKRVREIGTYVNTADACFPTSIILAIQGVCATYDKDTNQMELSNYLEPSEGEEPIYYRDIAKVLDGQHRIEGLRDFIGESFEVNVSIFIDADIADQAYIFSTVNLTQTKVNRSLAYDLFDLAKSRSPQKTCHNIAVALDQSDGSPFFERIKRLGVSTEGRFYETITQATFVQSLIVYICKDQLQQITDRDTFLKSNTPPKANAEDLKQQIFRNMFIDEKDLEIASIIWNYFDAVKEKWSTAWEGMGRGNILNKTNGFKAFMRFLRPAYLFLKKPGDVPSKKEFLEIFERIDLKDAEFTIDKFKPGSTGESELYRTLISKSKIAT